MRRIGRRIELCSGPGFLEDSYRYQTVALLPVQGGIPRTIYIDGLVLSYSVSIINFISRYRLYRLTFFPSFFLPTFSLLTNLLLLLLLLLSLFEKGRGFYSSVRYQLARRLVYVIRICATGIMCLYLLRLNLNCFRVRTRWSYSTSSINRLCP